MLVDAFVLVVVDSGSIAYILRANNDRNHREETRVVFARVELVFPLEQDD